MTPTEMQQNSAKKVQQVLDLMSTLHIRVEAKQKIDNRSGFLENMIMWHDDENYPAPAPEAAAALPAEAAPEEEKKTDEVPPEVPVEAV